MSSYWSRRLAKDLAALFQKSTTELDANLAKRYRLAARRIIADMKSLYLTIELDDNKSAWISHLYQYDRYYTMLNNINDELTALGSTEIELIEPQLVDMYMNASSLVGEQINLATDIRIEDARRAVNTIWCADGKNWSNRIWANKIKLKADLEETLTNCIASGQSHLKFVENIQQNFGSTFAQAERLVRTEMNFAENQAALDRYVKAGFEEYEILSNQATDSECAPLNGARYPIMSAKIGINFPPFHPNCRCTVIPVVKGA